MRIQSVATKPPDQTKRLGILFFSFYHNKEIAGLLHVHQIANIFSENSDTVARLIWCIFEPHFSGGRTISGSTKIMYFSNMKWQNYDEV